MRKKISVWQSGFEDDMNAYVFSQKRTLLDRKQRQRFLVFDKDAVTRDDRKSINWRLGHLISCNLAELLSVGLIDYQIGTAGQCQKTRADIDNTPKTATIKLSFIGPWDLVQHCSKVHWRQSHLPSFRS